MARLDVHRDREPRVRKARPQRCGRRPRRPAQPPGCRRRPRKHPSVVPLRTPSRLPPRRPLGVIQRVQAETLELLRRHAAMVATARGSAPTPPETVVREYGDALERVAAWLRVYGFFDALAV